MRQARHRDIYQTNTGVEAKQTHRVLQPGSRKMCEGERRAGETLFKRMLRGKEGEGGQEGRDPPKNLYESRHNPWTQTRGW